MKIVWTKDSDLGFYNARVGIVGEYIFLARVYVLEADGWKGEVDEDRTYIDVRKFGPVTVNASGKPDWEYIYNAAQSEIQTDEFAAVLNNLPDEEEALRPYLSEALPHDIDE